MTDTHTHRDRQTDASDLIICPMLCYSNGTDKKIMRFSAYFSVWRRGDIRPCPPPSGYYASGNKVYFVVEKDESREARSEGEAGTHIRVQQAGWWSPVSLKCGDQRRLCASCGRGRLGVVTESRQATSRQTCRRAVVEQCAAVVRSFPLFSSRRPSFATWTRQRLSVGRCRPVQKSAPHTHTHITDNSIAFTELVSALCSALIQETTNWQ